MGVSEREMKKRGRKEGREKIPKYRSGAHCLIYPK